MAENILIQLRLEGLEIDEAGLAQLEKAVRGAVLAYLATFDNGDLIITRIKNQASPEREDNPFKEYHTTGIVFRRLPPAR